MGYPLSRSDEVLEEVVGTFLDLQSNEKHRLTDVHLICKDGVIPVHAIILKAASKLFAAALASQGDCYDVVRTILLPDYCIKEICHVIQIIYSGRSTFADSDEVENIEDILKQLCVDNFTTSKWKGKSKEEADDRMVRCYLTKNINRSGTESETNILSLKPLVGNEIDSTKKRVATNRNASAVHLRGNRIAKTSDKSPSASESDNDSSSDYKPKKKSRIVPKNSTAVLGNLRVVMERSNILTGNLRQTTLSSNVQIQNKVNTVPVRRNNFYNSNSRQYQNNDDDGTDPDSDDWEEPDYNNKAWFDSEARRCQKCKKQHVSPAEASTCVTSHQRLRCYFCFAIAKNTENLFEHFTKKHKQAGRENCLMCPYCEQTVPFKSVSCHVISIHLTDHRSQGRSNVGYQSSVGRPQIVQKSAATVNTITLTNAPANALLNQKPNQTRTDPFVVSNTSEEPPNDDILSVGNLDVTIRTNIGNGKIMVYHLQKDRSVV